MSNIYKTARGQIIDIDKLKLTNETINAVGNMRTNSRGDVLGVGNQVSSGRNAVMDQVYAVPTANNASEGYSPRPNAVTPPATPTVETSIKK